MAQGVTPDGIAVTNRIEGFTNRRLLAKVVDNVLASRTYMSRQMGMGKRFTGKTLDVTVKVTDSDLGEFFTSLEELNSSASDTTIELSYAHTGFSQPVVSIMLESMANSGPEQQIDLDQYKVEEAVAEAVQKLGTALYATGSGDQPLGLGAHIDDGTDVGTIGGQSRTTYSVLNATRTASGGTLTLAKMGTLDDNVSATGIADESPNIGVTTKTVWGLYEQLLQPQVRNSYTMDGGQVLPVRGNQIVTRKDAGATGGFTALTFRGFPIIKDDAATAQNLFFINERYLFWAGRDIVPSKWQGLLQRVRLGQAKTVQGVGAFVPPSDFGWFFQPYQVMPNQAGMIGRYYVVGQLIGTQPRRQGRLTGVTGV
jgi:hypothetical protein